MHNFDHTHQNFKSVGIATPTSKLGPAGSVRVADRRHISLRERSTRPALICYFFEDGLKITRRTPAFFA